MTINKNSAATLGGLLTLAVPALAWCGPLEFEFDALDFNAPTVITNDFWGLRPFAPAAVYFAESDDGCEVSESVVRMAPVGPGFFDDPYDIQAIVVHDRAWVAEDCENYTLVEDTDDWYAQDDEGNVWYLGEDTTAWDDEENCLTQSGSWKAGDDEAVPGVIMLAAPRPGVSYQQEYYEDEAEDWAKVLRLNARVSIEFGEYAGCLMTKEYTPLSPGEVEHKYYCSVMDGGPGLALVNELKGKTLRVEYVGSARPPGTYGEIFPTSKSCSE